MWIIKRAVSIPIPISMSSPSGSSAAEDTTPASNAMTKWRTTQSHYGVRARMMFYAPSAGSAVLNLQFAATSKVAIDARVAKLHSILIVEAKTAPI
jgi:hypothetical protein